MLAGSAAAVCLVLFGLVYFVGLRGSPAGPASSSAARGSVSSPRTGVAAPAAGSAQAPHIGLEPAAGARGAFVVTASGTRYQAATLAAQVRARLSAHSSGTGPASAPPPTLAACVLHLTGNVRPELVDRATYQGRAAYVIAVSSRVWVVGPGCTAGDPRLITTVSLAG